MPKVGVHELGAGWANATQIRVARGCVSSRKKQVRLEGLSSKAVNKQQLGAEEAVSESSVLHSLVNRSFLEHSVIRVHAKLRFLSLHGSRGSSCLVLLHAST